MERNYSIQFLLAVAAALVVFSHSLITFSSKVYELDLTYFESLHLGTLGVEIFFVISGFIIYKTTINLPSAVDSSKSFFIKRIIRIVPIYWVAIFIYYFKSFVQGEPFSIEHVLYSMFFFPYVNETGLMRPVLGVGWTLNYEMLFYSILTVAILFKSNSRVFFVTIIIVLFLLFLDNTLGGYSLLSTKFLLFFLVGVFIAQLEDTRFYIKDKITLLLVPLLIFLYILFRSYFSLSNNMFLFFDLFFSGFIVLLAVISVPTDNMVNSFRKKVMFWITKAGDGSYSTYLFHGLILGASARVIAILDLAIPPLIYALFMVLITAIVGYYIYVLMELPIIRYLNKRVKVKSTLK